MLHLQLSEREVERLLAGQQPYGRPDLAEVAYFVARLRALNDFERPPVINDMLRQQLASAPAQRAELPVNRAAHALTDVTEQVTEHVRPGPSHLRRAEARRQAERARWRWRVVGAAAVFVALGGVAAAGWQGALHERDHTTTDLEPVDGPATTGPSSSVDAGQPSTPSTQPEQVKDPQVTEDQPGLADRDDTQSTDPSTPGTAPPSSVPGENGGGWLNWPPQCPPQDWVCWWQQFGGGGGGGRPPGEGGGNGDGHDR